MMPENIEKNMYPTMMPENFEKNMYLRRRQGKITLLWCPKNTDNLWFFFNQPIMIHENFEKNMYLRRGQGKIKLLWQLKKIVKSLIKFPRQILCKNL